MIVIKYGGSLFEEPGHRSAFLKDLAKLSKTERIILVHGGGKEISRRMEAQGMKPKFVNGRRYTDGMTMFFVEDVLSGLNNEVVAELQRYGAECEGFSGRQEHLVEADPIPELGSVGQNLRIDAQALEALLKQIHMPVFYSVAEDVGRQPLNINADDFAQALAIACQADALIFLTDVAGVMGEDGKRIPQLNPIGVERLIKKGTISGGMAVKVLACLQAIEQGVKKVAIGKNVLNDAQGLRLESGTWIVGKDSPTVYEH